MFHGVLCIPCAGFETLRFHRSLSHEWIHHGLARDYVENRAKCEYLMMANWLLHRLRQCPTVTLRLSSLLLADDADCDCKHSDYHMDLNINRPCNTLGWITHAVDLMCPIPRQC